MTLVARGREIYRYEDRQVRWGMAWRPTVTAIPLETTQHLQNNLRDIVLLPVDSLALTAESFVTFAAIDTEGEIFLFVPKKSDVGRLIEGDVPEAVSEPYVILKLGKAGTRRDDFARNVALHYVVTSQGPVVLVFASSSHRTYRATVPLVKRKLQLLKQFGFARFEKIAEVGGTFLRAVAPSLLLLANEAGDVTQISGGNVEKLPRIPVGFLLGFDAYLTPGKSLEMRGLGVLEKRESAPVETRFTPSYGVFHYSPRRSEFRLERANLPAGFRPMGLAVAGGDYRRAEAAAKFSLADEYLYSRKRRSLQHTWEERNLLVGAFDGDERESRLEIVGRSFGDYWYGERTIVFPDHRRRPLFVDRLIENGIQTHQIGGEFSSVVALEDAIEDRLASRLRHPITEAPALIDTWIKQLQNYRLLSYGNARVGYLLRTFGVKAIDAQLLLLDFLSDETLDEFGLVSRWTDLTLNAIDEIEEIADFLHSDARDVLVSPQATTLTRLQSNAQKFLYFYARSMLGRSDARLLEQINAHLAGNPDLWDEPFYRTLVGVLNGPEGNPLWSVRSTESLRSFLGVTTNSIASEPSVPQSARP